jgi:hypothetical protein
MAIANECPVNIEITKLAHYYLWAYSMTKLPMEQSFKKGRLPASQEAADYYDLSFIENPLPPHR